MQLDVFTPIPHAFAWLTEQRPVATVLGTELDLRLFGYRDTTPLRAGQIDDEPYGGGAGMVLRVDVVAAALDAVYGGMPEHRVIALTPQGRQLTQSVVEELAEEERLTLLSARFEGFDERIVQHLASDAISIGPYVLSGGELPAMVLVDAIARRLPGALAEGSGEHESFSAELDGGLEYPHYTRPPEFRGWKVPEVLLSGHHERIDEWRRAQSRERTRPVSDPYDPRRSRARDEPKQRRAARRRATTTRRRPRTTQPPRRLRAVAAVRAAAAHVRAAAAADDDRRGDRRTTSPGRTAPSRSLARRRRRSRRTGWNPLVRLGVPQPWRGIIDWIVTIVGAIAIVFAIKAWVVNPYRIPSSSMEPTLHCASTGGSGCLARFSDRVLANRFIYHLRDPRRGEIIVFNVPDIAEEKLRRRRRVREAHHRPAGRRVAGARRASSTSTARS